MLGDEAQQAGHAGSRDGVPAGPRHAAPRKSLLTKLHVPAGKAVALAAMPTAVLMGMGFTPHLAQADDSMPKSGSFKPGPCVTQSDTAKDSAAGKDGAKATPTPTTSPSATGSAGKDDAAGKDGSTGTGTGKDEGAGATPKPSPSASAPSLTDPVTKILPKAQASPAASPSASPSATPTPSPTASPKAAKSSNPLDPLGVGDLLGGLLGGLTGGGSTPPSTSPTTQPPTPTPTASSPASANPDPTPTAGQTAGSGGSSAAKPSGSGSSSTGSAATDAGKAAANTVKGAVKGLTDAAGKAADPTPTPTATGASTPTDGSQSYPCPTYDAKALADASTETGIPLLPDDPWTLKSSKLALHGLNYDGIVQVRTWSGQVKDVLKFTATGVDIDNLWQIVDQPQGGHTWVKARAGSTSTIRNGTVTMYTESLSGKLLGLIPITFTPKAPPPLTLPELFFTDVTVVQAAQFGGDLHVPGMQVLPGQS